MIELIKIKEQDGEQVCSARELYAFLEIGQDFTSWCKRMFEYGFVEGEDYCLLPNFSEQSKQGGHNKIDYALKLDCAKEISMLQRTEKGRQARLYFLECEKQLLKLASKSLSNIEIFQLAVESEKEKERLRLELKAIEPMRLFSEAVTATDDCISMGELAKILKQMGIQKMGRNRLTEWLRAKGYLIKQLGIDWNMPTQMAMEKGLFRIHESTTLEDGKSKLHRTTRITGTGQQYFINLFLNHPGSLLSA